MLFLLKPFPGGGGPPVDPPEGTPFELVSINVIVEVRLSGTYEDMVIEDMSPTVYYPMDGTTADLSGNGNSCTIVGSPALVPSLIDAGNSADTLATSFDGVNDVIRCGDICEFAGLVPFTTSCWIQVASIHATRTMRILSKEDDDVNGQQGWSVSLLPQSHATHAGYIQFARVKDGSVSVAYSPIAVTTGVPHHVLCEYGLDLSVRVWLDGVIGTPVSSTQVMIEHTRPLSIGGHSFETTYYTIGTIDEVAIAPGTPMTLERIGEHAAQGWTPIEDACSVDGIRIRSGIDGITPLDCVAGPGECSFALRNDGGNSGGVQGWYSPANASVRAGWGTDIQCRVRIIHQGTVYTKFRGRIGAITPAPWVYGERRVHVVAYDLMHRLMMAGLRAIPIQVNQDDIALIWAVLNASLDLNETDEAVPLTRAAGLFLVPPFETYPYAFDDIARGTPALSAIHDVALSGLAMCYASSDGALQWQNRLMRSDRPLAATFDNAMHGLTVLHGVEKAFNHLRVAIHQRSVGSGNVVLWAWEGDPLLIFPGATKEIWAEFRDPDDVRDLIGAASVATPASGTDYAGDALPDGSGADRTASIGITLNASASSGLLTIVNNHATDDIYLVNNAGQNLLQIRGVPIFHDGDQTFEDATGDMNRLLTLDLPYQVSPDVAQGFASYLTEAYSNPLSLEGIELIGNRSNAFMTQILARDVGDRIRVSETMTGMTLADAIIHSVEISIEQGAEPILRCRWGLGPYLGAIPFAPPPPAVYPGSPGGDPGDLIVNYSGAASGTHNLTVDGSLALTVPGAYSFAFNRSGVDVRVKGVAAGGPGGVGGVAADSYLGGGGGGGGASNTTGVVVAITSTSYAGIVGSPSGDQRTGFERVTPTVLTHLELNGGTAGTLIGGGAGGTAAVGAGGTAGSAGGAGGNSPAAATAGTAGVCGGGGGGGQGYNVAQSGAAGGNGTSQTGGAGGGNPSPNQTHDAEFGQPGNISGASPGQGGGGGGGVLLGGIYAGGGGGGGGGAGQNVASGAGGLGGQGVLELTLVP